MATTAIKPCPFCKEKIKADAIKCKHCGSMVSESGAGSPPAKSAKARDHSSYGGFTALAIIAPVIGLIIGIIYLTKSEPVDRKVGEHTLALSILFGIIWFVVLSVISASGGSSTTIQTY